MSNRNGVEKPSLCLLLITSFDPQIYTMLLSSYSDVAYSTKVSKFNILRQEQGKDAIHKCRRPQALNLDVSVPIGILSSN